MRGQHAKNKTREQHIVPATYLRHFTKEALVYFLDTKKLRERPPEYPRRRAPGSICWSDDYYTIRDEFPENHFNLKKHDTHYIEDQVLKRLEDKYPALSAKLTGTGSLTMAEAIDLCDLVVAIKLRNPYWLEKVIGQRVTSQTEALLREMVAERRRNDPVAASTADWVFELVITKLLRQQRKDPDYDKQMQLYSLRARGENELGRNVRIHEKFIDARWVIYAAPAEGPYFITTDNPGAAIGKTDGAIHTFKLDGDYVFYFPLSYRHLLLLTDNEPDGALSRGDQNKRAQFVNATPAEVHSVNTLVAGLANRLLIGAERTELDHFAAALRELWNLDHDQRASG
jgi:hypothetical protein